MATDSYFSFQEIKNNEIKIKHLNLKEIKEERKKIKDDPSLIK